MHYSRQIPCLLKTSLNQTYVIYTYLFNQHFLWPSYQFLYLYNCSNLFLMFSIQDDDFTDGIPRSLSVCDTENKMLPTVFRWEGGGKQVFISGTFSEWKPIPMVQRYFSIMIFPYSLAYRYFYYFIYISKNKYKH